MKIHHREMLLHASALLHQTGDLLAELVRTVDEDRDADQEIPTASTTFDEPRPYYVQRTAHEIWGQREWLTENEIAAKLHGVWNIARGVEREEGSASDCLNRASPDREESVMEFSKRAATEFVDSRLGNKARSTAAADLSGRGFEAGSYAQEKTTRAFDEMDAKQQAMAQDCQRQRGEKPVAAVNALDLVVTLNGVPFRDQTLGIRLFKEACDNSIERERNGMDTPPYFDRG